MQKCDAYADDFVDGPSSASASSGDSPRLQVKLITGTQRVIRLAAVIQPVGDKDVPGPDNRQRIALDQGGRVFVDSDAKNVGVSCDDLCQVTLTTATGYVLIDRSVPEIAEALLVA